MVRLGILAVLLCATFWEWRRGARKSMYYLALLSLLIFFSLRYGQGTDYLTYLSIYANVPPLSQFPLYTAYSYNKIEIGFFYIISFCRMLGLHYTLFIAAIAAFSFFGIHRFIKRFCPLPVFALTFFYAVYSLVYMESAIRQMLAVGIALGFILPDFVDGKRLRPLLLTAVASLIHTSAALLFVIFILFHKERSIFLIKWPLKRSAILCGVLLAAAAVVNFVNLTSLIEMLPARIAYTILSYYTNRHVSLMPLLNRTLFMLIVLALVYKARNKLSPGEVFLYNLYCIGYALYLLLMSSDLIASRVNLYFRIVDMCLIPLLFQKNRDLVRRTFVALPTMLALCSFLYLKDVSAVMDNAQYYSRNPLHYPYITVFNSSAVMDAKFVNVKNAQAMNAYQAGGLSYDAYYRQLQRKPSVRSTILPY